MTYKLKLRKVGSSLGVIIPKEVLTTLNVQEGDPLYITEGGEGLHLVADDPDFAEVMASYRKIARKYRNTLGELAK